MHFVTYKIIFCLFIGAAGHHINDTYRLIQDKLTNYDKTIRPTANQSETTVVKFTFSLVSLHELDEVNQRLSVVSLIGLMWTDDMMKWDPAEYGNMTTFQTESGRFWTPNLFLSNSAEGIKRTGADWQSIRFFVDGSALYVPMEILYVSCQMDVTFYPWDRQRCVLSFTPQGYPPNELRIEPISTKVDMIFYYEHGTWNYINSTIVGYSTLYYSTINVFLVFERKPRFAIINVILPIIFMSFLSVVVFLIPQESGERISYTITMLLAIAVFLTLVGDNLPKTSTPIPIFSYYLLTMLGTSICITLATIFNLRLYHTDDKERAPRCLAKIFTCCRKRMIKKYEASFQDRSNKNLNTVYLPDEDKQTESIGRIQGHLLIQNDVNSKNNKRKTKLTTSTKGNTDGGGENNEDEVTWNDISGVVDIFFFIFFLIIFIVATVVFFVMVFYGNRWTKDEFQDTVES